MNLVLFGFDTGDYTQLPNIIFKTSVLFYALTIKDNYIQSCTRCTMYEKWIYQMNNYGKLLVL